MSSKKIEDLKGKSWMYKRSICKVLDTQIGQRLVVIKTDSGNITFDVSEVEERLKLFLPVRNEEPTEVAKVPATIEAGSIASDMIMPLKDVVLASIEKLKEDKGYIPQASAINKSINTLINMARLEIQIRSNNRVRK